MRFLSTFTALCAGMAGAAMERRQRLSAQDALGEQHQQRVAQHLRGYEISDAERNIIQDPETGRWIARGVATAPQGYANRFATSAASYEEALAAWNAAFLSVSDPDQFGRVEGIRYDYNDDRAYRYWGDSEVEQ